MCVVSGQFSAGPVGLENASGGAVALGCVAVVDVGDDAEGHGALTATMYLDKTALHVTDHHHR